MGGDGEDLEQRSATTGGRFERLYEDHRVIFWMGAAGLALAVLGLITSWLGWPAESESPAAPPSVVVGEPPGPSLVDDLPAVALSRDEDGRTGLLRVGARLPGSDAGWADQLDLTSAIEPTVEVELVAVFETTGAMVDGWTFALRLDDGVTYQAGSAEVINSNAPHGRGIGDAIADGGVILSDRYLSGAGGYVIARVQVDRS